MKLMFIQRRDAGTPHGLREHVERRARFAFGRFADAIGSVRVRLEDLNGPRGGIDKRCVVQLRGPALGEVVVEETDSGWAAAIDRALSIAGRTVARALGRSRPARGLRPAT